MLFLTMMRVEDDFYLAADDSCKIIAYLSLDDALKSLRSAYGRFSRTSYEGAMSAAVHRMAFRPRVVAVESAESLKGRVVSLKAPVRTLSHVSGWARGVDLVREWR